MRVSPRGRQNGHGCSQSSAQPLQANRLLLSLLRLLFPQCAILGPGAAFQLQQETIKKFVLFLVREKCW